MSEGPELSQAEAFAAEHALGVLTAAERAQAELRMAREPAFAADVEAWAARLAPMVGDIAGVEPPAAVPVRDDDGAAVLRPASGVRLHRVVLVNVSMGAAAEGHDES